MPCAGVRAGRSAAAGEVEVDVVLQQAAVRRAVLVRPGSCARRVACGEPVDVLAVDRRPSRRTGCRSCGSPRRSPRGACSRREGSAGFPCGRCAAARWCAAVLAAAAVARPPASGGPATTSGRARPRPHWRARDQRPTPPQTGAPRCGAPVPDRATADWNRAARPPRRSVIGGTTRPRTASEHDGGEGAGLLEAGPRVGRGGRARCAR